MGCIYLYTNKINGMQYVGQTINKMYRRHSQHVHSNDTYIDKAIQKYGIDNFKLDILEDNIFDAATLNEREKYYIALYDTFNNGYNLTTGGQGSATFDVARAKKIINDIKNTNLTFKQIGEKHNVSIYTVSSINLGETCCLPNIAYPVRKQKITTIYNQNDADAVIELLGTTDFSFSKIAELTNTNFYYVADINKKRIKSIDYGDTLTPIRKTLTRTKISPFLLNKILFYLKNSDLSADQIGNKLGVSGFTVGNINRGKSAFCKQLTNETFPIRKTPHRNKESAQLLCASLSKQQVMEIVNLLVWTDLNLEEIAKRYGITRVSVDRINQGKTWKNQTKDFFFPLRTNPKNKTILNG